MDEQYGPKTKRKSFTFEFKVRDDSVVHTHTFNLPRFLEVVGSEAHQTVARNDMNRKEENLALRRGIIALQDSGLSIRVIAQQLGLSPTTVAKWISRWNTNGNLNDLRRSDVYMYLVLFTTI